MAASEEKLIAEFPGVKFNKQRGVLLLTSLRVAWAPDVAEKFQTDHLYETIKAQRVSAETSSKVQLQLVLHSGAQVKFHFTADNAVDQRQQVKTYLSQRLSQSVRISPELEAKNSLLKSKPSLYQLYKDLVTTSIINADEFWANYAPNKDSSSDTSSKGQQQGGLPSAFLADVQAVHDGCNTTRYNLSPDAMQAIFKTYPEVRKKHLECVPDKISEEQFWTKFFQSQLLHQQDSSGGGVFKGLNQLQGHTHTSVALNTTELSSTILDHEGYGSCHGNKSGSGASLSLLHRCNDHSSRVLHVLQGDTPPNQDSAHLSTPMQSSIHLDLNQPLMQTNGGVVTTPPLALQSLAHSVNSWQLSQEVDLQNAQSAVSHFAPDGILMSSGCGQKGTALLTDKQQQEVFRHQAAVAELLRHFWACFPARTSQLEAKVHRLHQCLVDYSNKQLLELQAELDHSDSLRIVEHLAGMLEKAVQHYAKWISKKRTR